MRFWIVQQAPKGRGIRRRDGEPFSYGGEPDVGLADASKLRRKRWGMRPGEIQRPALRRYPSGQGRGGEDLTPIGQAAGTRSARTAFTREHPLLVWTGR